MAGKTGNDRLPFNSAWCTINYVHLEAAQKIERLQMQSEICDDESLEPGAVGTKRWRTYWRQRAGLKKAHSQIMAGIWLG